MNKLISLIKTDVKNTYSLSSFTQSMTSKKNLWVNIIMGIAILSLLPSYYFMIRGLSNFYDIFFQIGQESYLLNTGIFASQLLIFVFGILYVMSKFYFSSDLNQLIPLPIKPSYIIGSKFASLMISEYITSLPVVLPFIILYGSKSGEGVLYWIYAILLILILPVIPLSLASLLVMLFMKYTNIGAKKDLVRVIGAVLFIIIAVWIQYSIQKLATSSVEMGEDFLIKLAEDSQYLVRTLGIVFPPSMWGTLALANSSILTGLLFLLLLIGISALSIFIVIYLSESIFLEGLLGNVEVATSRGKGSLKELDKTVSVAKPALALAKKELIMLFKTPVYLINSIGGVIIIPVILVMSLVTTDESMEPVMELLDSYPNIVNLGVIGIVISLAIINSIGSTTFSREGKNFWIQRVLPIKASDQAIGRILSSLVVQMIGIAILIPAIFFIKSLSFMDIILIILIGLLGSIPMTQIGMLIDISRPMLVWDNPQRAMKQNFNLLITMGVCTLIVMGLFFLVKSLIFNIDIVYIYIIIAGILSLMSIILHNILVKLIDRQFVELE